MDFTNYSYFIDFENYNWKYILNGIALSIISSLFVITLLCFVFRKGFRHLKNMQKISRMFISKRFYEEESYQSTSSWSLNESGKTVTKQRMVYFPKAYYKLKNGYIHFRINLDMTRYQSQYLKLTDDLESGLYCTVVEKNLEENFVVYKLLYDVEKQRINIDNVIVKDGSIKLMNHINWEFDKQPHMLIAGGTGGGKTYFILTLIEALYKSGATIKILDPKNADLADLEEVMPSRTVFSQKNGIKMTLHKAREEMKKRTEEMKLMPSYKTGGNYASVGMKPYFVIFDEYVAFMEMLDIKEKQQVLEDMKQLTMLGRQAGVFLILANQRPDAKYLADGIRDQFNFRVALGRNSITGYNMMFGDVDNEFIQKDVKGRGYLDYGGSVITEFYTPLVPNGYDFLKQIKSAVTNRESAQATTVASDSAKHSTSEFSVGRSVASDNTTEAPPS